MRSSMHAKRMARNHRRHNAETKLNLVSLMDIFTILVFFLMVNSGDVEVLSADKNIKLPDSIADKKPALSLTIKISDDDVLVQDRVIAALSPEGVLDEAALNALTEELNYQASRRALSEKEKINGRPVIIMGDKAMPYTALKQLMTTCSANDYRDIALAVNQITVDETTANTTVSEG